MRFNSRELAFVAQTSSDGAFDKQGVLQIKEKQEGLFRKGEVYMERWVKLRGNLLFYFKSKDPRSEVTGVIVLERCTVELDPDEELDFSFVLRFEADERTQYLGAKSERERDKWIAALHIASYECMQMQLESLREQIKSKTGKDPLVRTESHNSTPLSDGVLSNVQGPIPGVPGVMALNQWHNGRSILGVSVEHGEPFLELCLSSKGLPRDSSGKAPNSFASVCISTPPQHHWLPHAHSEVVERSCNPEYLTTASFSDPNTVTLNTKVRVTVYDVRERMTNTMTQIGSASFTVTDLLTSPQCRLTCKLSSVDYTQAGSITVVAWQDQSLLGVQEMHPSQASEDLTDNRSSEAAAGICTGHSKRLDMIKPLYSSIISKSYCFPTNNGSILSVHEYMAESNLTYALPIQLLKIWVEEERARIEHLQDLGELTGVWDVTRRELMDFYMSTVTMYMQHARYLTSYKGPPFKPSVKKGHKEVEFAPVNLHLQRMWVSNETDKTASFYDVITVGAFTAYAQKFKHGGLKRLMKQVKDSSAEDSTSKTRLEKVNEVLNQIVILRDHVHNSCDALCRAAIQGDLGELQSAMGALQDKARQLISVCESSLVEEGVKRFIEAKKDQEFQLGYSRPYSDPERYLTVGRDAPMQPSPEKTWKWSGTDFIKSPTEEPWELTRLNTEAAIVCVLSKVEELAQQANGESAHWLEELSPLVIKLKSCAEVTTAKAKASLTLITLEDSSQNVALLHTIKYRRDVVFAQALTAAVAGFMTQLRSFVGDESYLKQLAQVGILMQFESFLSCHGDEMAMLEDMAVGVADLHHVSFKLVECTGDDNEAIPRITGNRTGYVLEIYIPQSMFRLLPKELQRGQTIKVAAVVFNIGINEQATFAERFGDMSLQEQVNLENFQRLSTYCEKYCEIIGEPDITEKGGLSMELLLRNLHVNVMSKKSKNVEVLFMAAEACRRLRGIRFTNCKSGKDRTSMGATLEEAQLLQKKHDLSTEAFLQVLDCIRSEGVRRENTLKNCGQRKYAFNSLQMLSIPKLYRPPHGTFGNVQT